MTTLELPEPELFPVSLVPHRRVVLGGVSESQDQPGRLALGRPVLQPLTVETVDEDARAFLRCRTGSRFTLLTLTASFIHDEEKPFESAWVDVTIRCQDAPGVEQPVAWSMKPRLESDVTTILRKVSVNASLKLTIPGLPAETGPGASRERSETFESHMIKAEALNEGTSTPRWVFYPTEATEIRGIHRLCTVIDIPASVPGTAQISMGATIRLRRMKIFRYAAALTNVHEVAVVTLPVP